MKTALPPNSHSQIRLQLRRYMQVFPVVFAALLGSGTTLMATIAHPPYVSWIPDQRITSGTFVTQYFRILNFDGGTPSYEDDYLRSNELVQQAEYYVCPVQR